MFSKIIDFVTVLYNICRLDAKPQKLPCSTTLLALAFVLYAVVRTTVEVFDRPLVESGLLGLADAFLLAFTVAAPLWLLNLDNRIPQTLTAMASAGVVVSTVDIFVALLLIDMPLRPEQLSISIAFLTFPFVLWRILINTNLLRAALSWRFIYAFILALAHMGTVFALGKIMPAGLI